MTSINKNTPASLNLWLDLNSKHFFETLDTVNRFFKENQISNEKIELWSELNSKDYPFSAKHSDIQIKPSVLDDKQSAKIHNFGYITLKITKTTGFNYLTCSALIDQLNALTEGKLLRSLNFTTLMQKESSNGQVTFEVQGKYFDR